MANEKILVVDDDKNICELLRLYLVKEGYNVTMVHDGGAALAEFDKLHPDLVLLDVMMPVMDGWEVCRKLRAKDNTPIIMLTAKGETYDKVLGLELGADDYIVKPFDAKEVTARIKAVLRRSSAKEEENKGVYDFDNLHLDMNRYELKVKGKVVEAPPKELELLACLAGHPNRVYTRDQLLDEATASLDPENEVEVQKAIDSLIKGRTVIAIAHRLKTIKDADRIIVLDNGRIEEEGTHDELVKKDGLYAHLWNIQESISGWKL